MVFSTIIFLLRFLPITLALYYLAPPENSKNTVLFLCSLVFYCWGRGAIFPGHGGPHPHQLPLRPGA